jgi:hypothetical protein
LSSGIEVRFRDEHGREPEVLKTADEVDAFVDALLNEPHDRNCALIFALDRPLLPSGFFDHELAVGVDRTTQTGVATLRMEDDNLASRGSVDRGIVEYILMGHAREFMPGSEIPIADIRLLVKEFLSDGSRCPARIAWKEEQF